MLNIRLTFDEALQCCGNCGQVDAKVGDILKLSVDLVKYPLATVNPIRGAITAITGKQAGDPNGTKYGYQIDVDEADLPAGLADLDNCDLTEVECLDCCDINGDLIDLAEARLDLLEAKDYLFEQEVASMALILADGDWYKDGQDLYVMHAGEIIRIPYSLYITLTDVTNFGEATYLPWYPAPGPVTKRGTEYFFAGMRNDREMVAGSWDGVTLNRNTAIYTAADNPPSDHGALVMIPDGRNGNLIAAQCDHSKVGSNDIRFYVSTDGTVAGLTLKTTIIGPTTPSYIMLYRDGDRVIIIFQDVGRNYTDWRIMVTADYTVGGAYTAPIFVENPIIEGHYITTTPAKDGSGIWFLGGGDVRGEPSVIAGGDIQNARQWTPTITAPVFWRFADDALIVNGAVEVADVLGVITNGKNIQSRNIPGYVDKFEAFPWTNTNVNAVVNNIARDRWGMTGNEGGQGVVALMATGGLVVHGCGMQNISTVIGQRYTVSMYVAEAELSRVDLRGPIGCMSGANTPSAKFDVANRLVYSSAYVDYAAIEPAEEEGWFRIHITFTADLAVANQTCWIYLQDASWTSTFNSTTDTLLVQGYSIEKGYLSAFAGAPTGSRICTNENPLIYTGPKGSAVRVMKIRHIEDDFLEMLWAKYDGYRGVQDEVEATCYLYHARWQISTREVVKVTRLDTIGRPVGHKLTYPAGATIIGPNRVVYVQANPDGNGLSVVKLWDNGDYHVLAEYPIGDDYEYMQRPEAVLVFDGANVTVSPDEFVLMDGRYVEYTEWGPNNMLLKRLVGV